MIDAPLVLALTAGMIATVNPCGFAMLPAYLGWFVADETEGEVGLASRLGRALRAVAAVAVGFVVVFTVVGVLYQTGVRAFTRYIPWAALSIGVILILLGVAMLAGWQLKWRLPTSGGRGPSDRGLRSMVGFGMSYGVASLSCTLPVFLSIVVGTVSRSSWTSGLAALGAYVVGMTAVLALVTLLVATAKHSMLARMQQLVRHVNRAAAVLLIVSGAFIVYYWTWGLTADFSSSNPAGYGPIRQVEEISATLSNTIDRYATPIAVAALAAVVVAATAVVIRGTRRPSPDRSAGPDLA